MSALLSILDAAERVFANFGYEGASMRKIAQEAGVAQALIHYHFDNKEKLYSAVFERRADLIAKRREEMLDALVARKPDASLEDVLDIMLTSVNDVFEGQPQNKQLYVRMVASLGLSNDDLSRRLVSTHFDPTARKFIAVLQQVVPGLSNDLAVWAYLFMLGARSQAHKPSDRANRLGAKGPETGPRSPYAMLATFAAGGIRALAASGAGQAPAKPRRRVLATERA